VGLQGCGDFVGRLQRVVDGPIPCSVVNHRVSIAPPRPSGVLELTGPAASHPNHILACISRRATRDARYCRNAYVIRVYIYS
jgi:hypothetical protein